MNPAVAAESAVAAELVVRPVSSRHERRLFLEFPWELYADDPLWVPPLRHEQAGLVGYRRHPFYERNSIQTFLAFRGGQVCGRIAAIENTAHNEYHNERRGFFGFFDCRDDPPAAQALLDAALQWTGDRGLQDPLRGPMSPGVNYMAGALVEGFDRPPSLMMPYNAPYYDRLITGCGFHKTQDLYAYYGHVEMLDEGVRDKLLPVCDQIIDRYQIKIRPMRRSRFRQDVVDFLSVLNQSLTQHWSFVPFSSGELAELAKGLRWLLVPETAVGAEIDGRLVGVAIAVPDYGERIKRIDGRLLPFGFLRLLPNKRKIKRYRLLAANVVPAYQRMGIGLVLGKALVRAARGWGAEEVEISWIAESNLISRGAVEKGGAKRIKTYRVYDADQ